jgi:hypothetical protein
VMSTKSSDVFGRILILLRISEAVLCCDVTASTTLNRIESNRIEFVWLGRDNDFFRGVNGRSAVQKVLLPLAWYHADAVKC